MAQSVTAPAPTNAELQLFRRVLVDRSPSPEMGAINVYYGKDEETLWFVLEPKYPEYKKDGPKIPSAVMWLNLVKGNAIHQDVSYGTLDIDWQAQKGSPKPQYNDPRICLGIGNAEFVKKMIESKTQEEIEFALGYFVRRLRAELDGSLMVMPSHEFGHASKLLKLVAVIDEAIREEKDRIPRVLFRK